MLVLCIIMIVVSMIFLIKPDWVWLIAEKWKGNADEASELYIFFVRLTGIVFLVGSLISLVLLLLSM